MIRKKVRLTAGEYEKVCKSIRENQLSNYQIEKKDFIAYFDDINQLVGYARIFKIGINEAELSSLFINQKYRHQGYASELIQDCINYKLSQNDELYLACNISLKNFYEKLGFIVITDNIPEKLIHTLKRAKTNKKEMLVLKYLKPMNQTCKKS